MKIRGRRIRVTRKTVRAIPVITKPVRTARVTQKKIITIDLTDPR